MSFFHSLNEYEAGIADGIEQGHHMLLIKLLKKKLGYISEKYIDKIELLEKDKITDIALSIFDIKNITDLDKYFA